MIAEQMGGAGVRFGSSAAERAMVRIHHFFVLYRPSGQDETWRTDEVARALGPVDRSGVRTWSLTAVGPSLVGWLGDLGPGAQAPAPHGGAILLAAGELVRHGMGVVRDP